MLPYQISLQIFQWTTLDERSFGHAHNPAPVHHCHYVRITGHGPDRYYGFNTFYLERVQHHDKINVQIHTLQTIDKLRGWDRILF